MKKQLFQKCGGVTILTAILLFSSLVSKAQLLRFSPLTAQQIEKCEGDQFYVDFDYPAGIIYAKWDTRVFNVLQHTVPVKSITSTLSNYTMRNIFDVPTLVKDKESPPATFDYNGDYFVAREFMDIQYDGASFKHSFNKGERIWQYSGFGEYYRPSPIEAMNRTEEYCVDGYGAHYKKNYSRDEKGRVKRITFYYKNKISTVVDYTYRPNSDYISTIKHYDGHGKIMEEVSYNYVFNPTNNKVLLCNAKYKNYEYEGTFLEIVNYRLEYNNAFDVQKVEMSSEKNASIYHTETINVHIERDKKGNITTCNCELTKDERKEYIKDKLIEQDIGGLIKNVQFKLEYDDQNNWTTLTKEMFWNGSNTTSEIKREFAFCSSQNAIQKLNNTKPQKQDNTDGEEVFTIVEEMPDFYYGGMAGLSNYLARNIKYPQEALAKGIQGRVFLSFIIEPDGSLSNVNVMRSLGGGCDEEAVRVVKSMPKWKPGRQDGKAVRVSYILPVNFQSH